VTGGPAAGEGWDPRDVVATKRDGRPVHPDDLRRFVLGYARGEIADYQAAAFLMAAYLNGLSTAETAEMTRAMVESGITLPLSGVTRPKVDKHSTGGVSDGVTLVFAPLAASVGLAVAKLSGRGLGHTGGTLDKLESIPGLTTRLEPTRLERQVEDVGCAVAGQTSDLVPADGALYALRDATATVPSIPLIAASVMSKKLAVGTDLILLDVKAGSGAFMKTPEEALSLATACVDLASAWGRRARAAVTDMSQPLGRAIGNALDVAEAVAVLRGEDRGRVRRLSILFAAAALEQLGLAQSGQGAARVEEALDSGAAAETFGRMVAAQGGDARVVEDPWEVLPRAPIVSDLTAREDGWLVAVNAEALGRAAVGLGAGRIRKEDPIDPAVGIEFLVDLGQRVEHGGTVLARIHARRPEAADHAANEVLAALTLSNDQAVDPPPLVHAWVPDTDGATA
jgi:pyrimidine-nucleoside phosphorylase